MGHRLAQAANQNWAPHNYEGHISEEDATDYRRRCYWGLVVLMIWKDFRGYLPKSYVSRASADASRGQSFIFCAGVLARLGLKVQAQLAGL